MRNERRRTNRGAVRRSPRRYCVRIAVGLLILLTLSACGQVTPAGDHSISAVVLSFNVRYDNPGDGLNAWPNRRDRVASLIRFHDADVAGLQEALRHQIDELATRLPGYSWYGVGRDDGVNGGEFVPVFYRSDRFSVADSGTFWLSPTPEIPGSIGWDAAITRVITWVRLTDRRSGKSFFVFNAHFDHVGEQARQESARLLKARIEARQPRLPVVLVGDFNAEPESVAYAVLTSDTSGTEVLYDAAERASLTYGPATTFHGFAIGEAVPRRIDYVFVTSRIGVERFGVLTDQVEGRYPSDHLPVLAEVTIP